MIAPSWLRFGDRERRRTLKYLLITCLLLAGCARLKQCAYQGVNRDAWQQPDRVIAALQIQPGAVVVDLGAGGGYFTFKLADAAGPKGRVYAVDIDQSMVDIIAGEAKQRNAANVEAILGHPDDPRLPASVDLIFTSNTYHHIENRVAYFTKLRAYLRPSGQVAIVEFDRRSWLVGLIRHYTPSEFIKREMEQAGYVMRQEFDFLDRQSFLIFSAK